MLSRLSKLAAVSATLRALSEKRATVLDMAAKAGKLALRNPGKTALTIGAGVAGKKAFGESQKDFKQMAAPTPLSPGPG